MKKKMDENEVIEIFWVFKSRDDDVGVERLENGVYLVSSIDTFVGSSDMPEGMPLRSASYKALLSAISDLFDFASPSTSVFPLFTISAPEQE